MAREKEILIIDWDDVLFAGQPLLYRAASRIWGEGLGARTISDYALPKEWDLLADHFWEEPGGREKLSGEINLLLRQWIPARKDARSVIEDLALRWRIVLVGSLETESIQLSLRDFSDSFEFVLGGDVLGAGKPDPEIYLRALDSAGAPEESAIVLAGSRRGAQAAARSEIEYYLRASNDIVLRDPLVQNSKRVFWELRDLLRWL